MNNQAQTGIEAQDSEVIHLNLHQDEDDEESFGDLGDTHAEIEEQPGQQIVIDEDTMESNDLLISCPPQPIKQPLPPPSQQSRSCELAEKGGVGEAVSEGQSFYKSLVRKLAESSYNEQTLQPSWGQFEAEERRFLQHTKILYCHFILNDKPLSQKQYSQLRSILYVPKYGEALVRWANRKYSHKLTLCLVLERLQHMERRHLQAKRRCRQELRLLVMLVMLVLVIKLLS